MDQGPLAAARRGKKRRSYPEVQRDLKKVQRNLNTRTMQLNQAQQALQEELASKRGRRIENMWLVRAGLASPSTPAMTLSRWCRDLPSKETKAISNHKVSQVRDTFAELLKHLNQLEIIEGIRASIATSAPHMICGL